jgi:threonine dehydrogenase-like Zn-dependent dehydrogenase
MKALRFDKSMPRIALTKVLGQLSSRAFVAPFAPLRLVDTPEPPLPRPDWVRIRTRLAGICGSDVKQVVLNGRWDNPMTALVSFPHVLGHEAVGTIEEVGPAVRERRVGERILLDPWLACKSRGIEPPCEPCKNGDHTMCRNFDAGGLPPGIHLGNNAGAPGAFADCFVAHESQCFPIPDAVSDDAAVLGDPFSVSLHSILRNPPVEDAPAMVYGLGTLGLMSVLALRRLYPELRIYGVARFGHQAQLARRLGANEIITGSQRDVIERVAELCGAKVLRPWSGLPWLLDGAGVVYDTVGSRETIEAAIRVTRTRGTVVVTGVEIPRRFEWTPIYFKEVAIVGSNAFALESYQGRRVHALAMYLDLAAQGLDATPIITHHFPLGEWRKAFRTIMTSRATGAIKVVLSPAG